MRLHDRVEKGWGHEHIWVSTDHYCSKFLNFRTGAQFSMHFHREKVETWYVLSGLFTVEYIDTKTAKQYSRELKQGDVWHNDPLLPHRLIAHTAGEILEVSTADSVEDNYRVLPGDSQR